MPFAKKLFTTGWDDYELIDVGGLKKLERWGDIITIRPESQAYFKSKKSHKEWTKIANWEFKSVHKKKGEWICLKENSPKEWTINYNSLVFNLRLTKFKHLGLFPEQKCNWDYILNNTKSKHSFLNLFAYTGAASCAARSKKAKVYHVDSIKQIVSWAGKNMIATSLSNIYWINEDALKFAKREEKRKNIHDCIILDPPAWGYGVKKERWKLETLLEDLLLCCEKILKKNGYLILNTYSPSLDKKQLYQTIKHVFPNSKTSFFELWMKSSSNKELYFGNLVRIIK